MSPSRPLAETPKKTMSRATGVVFPLLAPVIVLAFDWLNHPFLFHGYGRKAAATYAGTALLSLTLWWAWASLIAQRHRIARIAGVVFVVVIGTTIIGGQRYMLDRFGVLVDDNYVGGTSVYGIASSVLLRDKITIVRAALPPLVAFTALAVALLRLRARFRPAPTRIAAPVAAIATVVAIGYASPSRYAEGAEPLDVLALSAIGKAAGAEVTGNRVSGSPGRRSPKPLPKVSRDAALPPRNVVFLLSESVRAENTCLDVRSGCKETPFSHRLAPNRIVFPEMHSLASNTLPSVISMWTGISLTSTREELHAAPLLWDYAQAAGFDTAYWTAQDLAYGNMQTFLDGIPARLRVSAVVVAVERDSLVGADERLLSAHVEKHAGELREPFFAVVHLSNTHMPYRVDEDDLPYLPQSPEGTNGNETNVLNRYRDAIYAQDKQVARIMTAFRNLPSGSRTVFVFTSDHGEQFREYGAVGHALTLSECEVHVPFWIDAPESTLTEDEREKLAAASHESLTHAMLAPTMLDLMGIADAPELAEVRAPMRGTSLLRTPSALPPMFLTNCSGTNACLRPSWGAMKGNLKLWANDGHDKWRCHDVVADPNEEHPSSSPECVELARFAEESARGVPFRVLR